MEGIESELKKFPDNVCDDVVILFSAHSLPMRVKEYYVESLLRCLL